MARTRWCVSSSARPRPVRQVSARAIRGSRRQSGAGLLPGASEMVMLSRMPFSLNSMRNSRYRQSSCQTRLFSDPSAVPPGKRCSAIARVSRPGRSPESVSSFARTGPEGRAGEARTARSNPASKRLVWRQDGIEPPLQVFFVFRPKAHARDRKAAGDLPHPALQTPDIVAGILADLGKCFRLLLQVGIARKQVLKT